MPRTRAVALVSSLLLAAGYVEVGRTQGSREAPVEPAPAPAPPTAAPAPAPEPEPARHDVASDRVPEWCRMAGTEAPGAGDVRRVEPGRYLVEAREVATPDLPCGSIVPAFRHGRAVGLKLFSIRPDSLYAKLGLRNGDVLREVNRLTLDSPDRALETYSRLKSTPYLEVLVERGDSMVLLAYCLL